MRRLALASLGLLLVATPALGSDITRKHQVDAQLSALQGRLAGQKQREQALRAQVAATTAQIISLESRVGDVSLRLQTLESDLALHQRRLDALTQLYRYQTERFDALRAAYAQALRTLEERIVGIYESERPTTLELFLGSRSIQEALDQVQYLTEIGDQDKRVAEEVAGAKARVQAARAATKTLRTRVQGETEVISARTAQTRDVRDQLVGARNDLSASRSQKLVDLSQLTAAERAEAEEIDALQAASNELAARIRAAQAQSPSTATPTRSSAGLAWPVQGPITSPFGWRWGRMHQGIDIGVPTGTPIHAAAAGRVIYCGWETGYGNLVVLDHGGNLATAYAHQSTIAVACGETVAQGQVIGYVGCTGHCTGPHLHFEVRVDGNPVDPMGYL